jgi:hypothetical protein
MPFHDADYRTLKRYGRLPNINLKDLDKLPPMGAGRSQLVATDVAETQWCGHPDYPDPEIAEADPADVARFLDLTLPEAEDLASMHAAMYDAAKVGSGSFPSGCHAEFPGRHSAKLHFDVSAWSSNYTRKVADEELQGIVAAKVWEIKDLSQAQRIWGGKPVVVVAVDLAVESFRRRGIMLFRESNSSRANIRLTCKPIGGSTIGLGWYNSQRCSDNVEARIDSGWKASLSKQAYLIAHEMGHCNNLPHEFTGQNTHRSVMSYSWPNDPFDGFRPGPPITRLPLDASVSRLIRYYGDEAVPPAPEWMGGTTPPPTGESVVWNWQQPLAFADGATREYAMQMTGPMLPGAGFGSFSGNFGKAGPPIRMQCLFQPRIE